MRSKVNLNPDGFICGKHRLSLGRYYKPSPNCRYSEQPPDSKSKGHPISWELYEYVRMVDENFILGSLKCKPCQSKLYNLKYEKLKKNEEAIQKLCDQDFVSPTHIPD